MKPSRPVLTVGSAALLGGIAIGWALFGTGEAAPGAGGSAAPIQQDAAVQLAQLQAKHDQLRAAYDDLEAQTTRAQLDRPESERHDADDPANRVATPTLGVEPTVSFGSWTDEPALRNADWTEMGKRVRDLVDARSAGIGGRQSGDAGAREKKSLRELHGHLGRIDDQRPELHGHPVVLVNLMASHLERAGAPLEPWQVESIENKGRQYEARAAQLDRDLLSHADAFASEKKLRSIQLSKQAVDEVVDEVLSRKQWDVLFDPETKGLLYYDVYQVGGLDLERPNSSVYWRDVRADGRKHLRLFLLTEWEIPPDDLTRLDGIVDQWIEAVLALPRHEGHPTSALHVDEVLPCCEVHVDFQKRVAAALAPEHAKRIRENPVFVVFPSLRSGQ